MKFSIGDDIDRALTTAISHEMLLCEESFDRFVAIGSLNILGRTDKATKLALYASYTRFLQHLYEFYLACYQRDRQSLVAIASTQIDVLLNGEVRKLLKNRRDAIDGGYAPAWENSRSVYEVEVPEHFAAQWRRVRNRTVHVSTKRSSPLSDIRLVDFYNHFHHFVYLLYSSAMSHWAVRDVDAVNWAAIEEFNLVVSAENPSNAKNRARPE